MQVVAHPFFNELRAPSAEMAERMPPNLFEFTLEEEEAKRILFSDIRRTGNSPVERYVQDGDFGVAPNRI